MYTLGLGLIAGITIATTAVVGISDMQHTAVNAYWNTQSIDYLGKLHDALGDARVDVLTYLIAPSNQRPDITDGRSSIVPNSMRALDTQIGQYANGFLSSIGHVQDSTYLRTQIIQSEDLMGQGLQALASWRQIRDDQVLPAVNSGNLQLATQDTLGKLMNAYRQYSVPFDQLVSLETRSITQQLHHEQSTAANIKLVLLAVIIASIVGVPIFFVILVRSLTRPLANSVEVLEAVATGDLRPRVNHDSNNEMGRMASALNQALDSLSNFLSSISQHCDSLNVAAAKLSRVSLKLQGQAGMTSERALAASSAAEEVSAAASSVSSTTTQLVASITAIRKSTSDAAVVSTSASRLMESANQAVYRLDKSIEDIGSIINLISRIAEQTNLLALNATIEAARAGEAGKGFSVVANEVKELANETTAATEKIGDIIDQIQSESTQMLDYMGKVSTVISTIDDHQSTIASSVEEQAAGTNEIARTISSSAITISEVSSNISTVANTAFETDQEAALVQSSAEDLSELASMLSSITERFSF